MEIRGTRVLVLGGSGLVGMAIVRELLRLEPAAVVISALTEREATSALEELAPLAGDRIQLAAEWGNLFVPAALKEARRDDLLDDAGARGALLDGLFGALSEEAWRQSTLGEMILAHRPGVVVDCVSTATGFAYQNVFKSAAALRQAGRAGPVDLETVEKHLVSMPLPHLIHHVWVALNAMTAVGTRMYLKIGTAGSGGMGLNIPFTHSEDRPSRQLLAKSAVAGAHTLLLYLMARTPGAPAVKEIKPTAAISWKRVRSGEVMRGGAPITRVDAVAPVPVREAFPSADEKQRQRRKEFGRDSLWRDTGEALTGVYLDAGENGLFSPDEFEAISALGLMEFITPEEIARDAVREIQGYPTGRDVVGALDASTSGPTYRAGVLRQSALRYMEEMEAASGHRSVGFEMLGPPRLTKLLFEAEILRRLCGGNLEGVPAIAPDAFARRAEALVSGDADLRTRILSSNLAILLPDGERLLRGRKVEIEPGPGEGAAEAARKGWVDLGAANWARWSRRAAQVLERVGREPGAEGGSQWDLEPWHRERPVPIRPGALAAWIFRYEDRGERIKR
jgi:NAD(P)-dependent dehydrogenase (short-subunit alcohol dehydrogenase family)